MHSRRPFLLAACIVAGALSMPAWAVQMPPLPPLGPTAATPATVSPAAPSEPSAASVPPALPAPVSLSARKVYEQARSQLVQIRTVLKGRASQTSVGSGFFVDKGGLIVTNFHVVSEAALKPERHDLVYVTADGREAPLQILQLDVRHDLALLRAADAPSRTFDALAFRTDAEPLAQGERIYSLGNPLDVGFAVVQGTYNGLVRRSFYPQIFFGGALSAGMSGGPALDEEGHVIGINVARRVDGEQVSFLVPASFAVSLLAAGRDAKPLSGAAYAIVDAQLMQHQQALTDRFIAQGWKKATHPRYHVPVPPDVFMRCWGTSAPSRTGGLDFERSDCVMDTRIFVGDFTTGTIGLRHESYDGSRLGPLRFAARYAQSFRNESFVRLSSQYQTKPRCNEDFVERAGLPLRAVVCMRAYKKLPQLYDVSVLVATLDQSVAGVQGRFDAQGVSFANAQRLTRHYLDAYGWAK
ncbi:MAG TPA: trypsin-like peptidase domain-containing protein [Caldimonas sp.]|nr:trypsin-like peptidase domain-containing protein [Caldimonas sp.]